MEAESRSDVTECKKKRETIARKYLGRQMGNKGDVGIVVPRSGERGRPKAEEQREMPSKLCDMVVPRSGATGRPEAEGERRRHRLSVGRDARGGQGREGRGRAGKEGNRRAGTEEAGVVGRTRGRGVR